MKFLKSYKIFESVNSDQFFKTKEDIKDWLDQMGIKDYTIHDDLIVDVDGNVSIFNKIPVQFGKVNGYFYCQNNQLISLEGCPEYVGGNFNCHSNQLTSLEGCPKYIVGDFSCSNNQLTSLKGCPEYIRGNFSCSNNQLISLEGCPESVGEHFYCSNNQLTSLEGCPKYVGGVFTCNKNKLKDFKGLNKFKNIYCIGNPIDEILELFNDHKCIQWINEYNVIQGDKINLENFKEVLYMMDIQNFDFNQLNKLKSYKVI